MTEERTEELMVKVADDVASASEREELMACLVDRPDLMKELEAHQALRAVSAGWVARLNHDLSGGAAPTSPSSHLTYAIGVLLFVGGAVLLMFGGMIEFWQDPEIPLWARAGMTGLGLGSILLLFRAVRHRLSHRKQDPYTEVNR